MNNTSEFIPIDRHPCNFKKFIETILKSLHTQAKGFDINLALTFSSEIPDKIMIDAEKTGWIITALIGNAFRFVRHGTRNLPGGYIQVDVGYDHAKQILLINIRDDGPGISKEMLPWLFKKNPQFEEATSGLALKLSHDILIAHKGSISAESFTEGDQRGTTFFIEVSAPLVV